MIERLGGDPGVALGHRPLNELLDQADAWLKSNPELAFFSGNARGLFIAALCLLLTMLVLPTVTWMLRRTKHLELNYRGNSIPNSFGVAFLFISIPCIYMMQYLYLPGWQECVTWYVGLTSFALLGLLDDLWGDKSIKGLRGHVMALFTQQKITTGFIKAIGGGLLALWIARQHEAFLSGHAVESACVIALSANAFNLLDLRPGRSCGIFLLSAGSLIYYWVKRGEVSILPLSLIWVPAWPIWQRDASAKVMLGDTGSNLIGAAFGMGIVFSPSSYFVRHGVLLVLVLFHLMTERYSLTKLIEKNRVLRFADSLLGERG